MGQRVPRPAAAVTFLAGFGLSPRLALPVALMVLIGLVQFISRRSFSKTEKLSA
jgi:hypothetical protein